VFFDNLVLTHTVGSLMEETHYYPFGLTMAGISSRAMGKLENRYKFNEGTELENKEFSDGAGLDLYSTEFRSYDPQIGRFHQIDPLTEVSDNWSPYSFVQNNPILYNDPLGLDTLKANADGSLPNTRADGSKLQDVDVILGKDGQVANYYNGESWQAPKSMEDVVVTPASNKKDSDSPTTQTIDVAGSTKPWMDIAWEENAKNVKEIPGSKANPNIIMYHKSTGGFKSDEIPWCSSFVNYSMTQGGNKGTNSASALSWRSWGQGSTVPLNGSVAVIIWGGGKGHVGFVVGKRGAYVALLGGNQGDRIKVALFKASIITTYRLPSNYTITKQDSILKTINGSINDFKGTR
jgi:uncharacterized protein (TIGR02594 family)